MGENTNQAVSEQMESSSANENENKSENGTKFVSKELFDRKVSELNKKRKAAEEALQARMSEEEKAEAERQEQKAAFEEMQKELSRLKNERVFLSHGYDEETSAKLAEAFASGDVTAFTDASSAWMNNKISEMQEKIDRLEAGRIPPASTGMGNGKPDVEFARNLAKGRKADPAEREKFLSKLIGN